MAGSSTIRVQFLGDSASAVRATKSVERGFGGLGKAATIAGAAITAGIVGGLGAAVKSAVAYDREMRNVNTITRLSEGEFKKLQKQVLGLAKETAQGPRTLAKGLYDIVSSGFKANDAIKILRVSAKAASAGLTDTATATKAINAALNAYHLRAEDARKVSDVLFETVNKGVLTFEELAQNMGDLVPAAAPLGVELEEVGAAIATITLQGVPAAEAATRVKNTMIALASPSKELSGLLKDNGFASGEAAIKARGFAGVLELLDKATHGNVTATAALTPEIRSLLGVVGLTGKNLDTYNANLKALEASQRGAGATSRAFAEQGKSISFQWQRAKAALEAAAIPLGQQLFPLLAAGAGKVEQFAEALPRLQQQLSPVGSALRDVGSALQFVGSHPEGQAAIVGLITAIGAAKVAGSLRALALGIGGLASPATLALGAIGLLAGVLFYSATRADQLKNSLDNLKAALAGQESAEENLARVRLRADQTVTQATISERALARERSAAAAILKQYGRDSDEYRDATLRVTTAEQMVTQLHQERKTAAKDVQRAEQALADASKAAAGATEGAYDRVAKRLANLELQLLRAAPAFKGIVSEKIVGVLRDYAKGIHDAERAAGNAIGPTRNYALAVIALYEALGRLPTRKEILIYVRVTQRGNLPTGGKPVPRATGGFIPHIPGSVSGMDSVPAILTPGEIVLNRAQQEKLGGPRFLAELFGFSGERGPGFAAGGIVPPRGAGRGPKPTRSHRPRRARPYQGLSRAAQGALRAVTNVYQRQDDLDRTFEQLDRFYNISTEEFVITDAEGNETLDPAAITRRLAEINSLIGNRARMLDLLNAETAALQDAIAALERAIEELLAEMRREQAQAQEDARRIRQLRQELRASEAEEDKVRKQKPKTKAQRKEQERAIARLDREQAQINRQIGVTEDSRTAHLGKAGKLKQSAADFRQDIGRVRPVLREQRFDWRDVELTILEYQHEADEIRRLRPSLPFAGGEGGGDGGGDGAGGGLVGPSAADILLGRGRFAAGIEAAQLKVIGQFARGTVHVPQTGLALVHAGERITPAAVAAPRVDVQAPSVSVIFEGDAAGLERFVKLKAVEVADTISDRIGSNAGRRQREGRF